MRILKQLGFVFLLNSSLVLGENASFFCQRLLANVRAGLVLPAAHLALVSPYLRPEAKGTPVSAPMLKAFEDDVRKVYVAYFDPKLKPHYHWEGVAAKWNLEPESSELLRAYYGLQLFNGNLKMLKKFGVKEESLKTLVAHHDLLAALASHASGAKNNAQTISKLKAELPKLRRDHKQALERNLFEEAMLAHLAEGGEFPNQSNRFWVERSPVSFAKALGIGRQYGRSGDFADTALYNGRIQASLILQSRYEQEKGRFTFQERAHIEAGLKEGQSTARRERLSEEFENKSLSEQREIFEVAMLSHLASSGVFPSRVDRFWPDLSPVFLEKALGVGRYALGNMSASSALSDGRVAASASLRRHFEREKAAFTPSEQARIELALKEGEDIAQREVIFQAFEEKPPQAQREIVEQALLAHVAKTGKFPPRLDSFWTLKGPGGFEKVLGVGNYMPDGKTAATTLNEGRLHASASLRARFQKEKNRFSAQEQKRIKLALSEGEAIAQREMKSQDFEKKPLLEQREIFEQTLLAHAAGSGVFPSRLHNFWALESPVGYQKALGVGNYKPDGIYQENALNTGRLGTAASLRAHYRRVKSSFTSTQQKNIEQALRVFVENTQE